MVTRVLVLFCCGVATCDLVLMSGRGGVGWGRAVSKVHGYCQWAMACVWGCPSDVAISYKEGKLTVHRYSSYVLPPQCVTATDSAGLTVWLLRLECVG